MRCVVVGLLLAASSCFNPNPPTGKACATPGDLCPPGLECIGGTCEEPGTQKDAAANCPWRSAFLSPCALPPSTAELLLDSDHTFDSDTLEFDNITPNAGVSIEVIELRGTPTVHIIADEIRVTPSASLRLVGARPVVLAAYTSIKLEGILDLSSKASRGAGGSPTNCPDTSVDIARGGAGGSQATVLGGAGGDSTLMGAGGTPNSPVEPAPLQAGCRGMRGGGGDPGGDGGSGGHGGGAIYLSAAALVEITGTIEAGGAGGGGGGSGTSGGSSFPGGGGGGAGGHIIVESPQVMVLGALIAANGGGGGGGSGDGTSGGGGQAAQANTVGGPGGGGNGGGGDGGKGGDSDDCIGEKGDNATAVLENSGGGGGGGACGRLDVYSDDFDQMSSTLSPGPTTLDLPE